MPSTLVASRVEPASFDWSSKLGPAADVRRLLAAATDADGRAPFNEALLLTLRHRGLEDATLYAARRGGPGGELVGCAVVHVDPGTHEPPEMNLVVSPDHRRAGVGTALLDEIRVNHGGSGLLAWAHGNHPGAAALAARAGAERVRDLWVMRRPLTGPDAAPLPPVREVAGVDVRPFRPGTDEDAVLAVNAAAFAHHPEQGDLTRADLEEREAEDWFDPAGFFLAWSGDRLVGFHWTKVHDPRTGEVYVVGVAPDAQGGGLGKLLTLTGLHHLADRGLAEVILYVEADNAAAVAVYRGLGFTHAEADTDVMYRLRGAARPSA